MIIRFKLERETPGAVRYMEVDLSGNQLPIMEGARIGTLYIRKSALNGKIPVQLEVEIKSI